MPAGSRFLTSTSHGRLLLLGFLTLALCGTVASCGSAAPTPSPRDPFTPPGPSHRASVPLPEPHSIDRDGTSYVVHEVPPVGALLDHEDGNDVSLLEFATSDIPDSGSGCGGISPSVRLVAEDSQSVTVAGFAYDVPVRGHKTYTYSCVSSSTSTDDFGYTQLHLRLRSPLDDRTLIDASTGQAIGVLDDDEILVPGFLPAGYTSSYHAGFDGMSSYAAISQYESGDRSIEIYVRSESAWFLSGRVLSHLSINGRRAVVEQEDYQRCVDWSDAPGIIREVCSLDQQHHYLSPTVLIRIANGLHRR